MERFYIQYLEKKLGVKRTTYFYWERVGKVPKAKRTKMGSYRYWTKGEIDYLKKIIKE